MSATSGAVDAGPRRPTGGPPVITALTGVRAVAATWVLLGHLVLVLAELFPATEVIQPWSSTGALGVDIFFVLSGFVISYNYAERMASLDRRRWGAFLFARFARLYPIHLLTFAATAAFVAYLAIRGAAPSFEAYTVGTFLGNIFLLQALPGVPAWNAPSWSISCEAAAYLVFPLFAAWLLRLRRRAALVLAVLVVAALLAAITAVGATNSSLAPMSWIRIGGEFTLGCLLWVVWRQGVRSHRYWDVVALASVLGTVVWLGFAPHGPLTFAVVPLLAAFVLGAAGAAGPVRAVLAWRPVEWAGRVSYSLYLTHFLVMILLGGLLSPASLAGRSLALRLGAFAVYVAVVFAVAALTYHLVEEPSRRWLRRWAARRPSMAADGRTERADRGPTDRAEVPSSP